jgi:serine/threonine protein kinase
MQACPKCGQPIDSQPNFCPSCGSSLTFSHGDGHEGLIGRLIDGTYRVEKLIGEGAMGRVYQARHITLKKTVALKILRSMLVSDITVVRRFKREAQAASRLNHPNCIAIYGFGQEDEGELLWMAMEYVHGRDLGTIITEDAPLRFQRVVNIMSQVCDALDEAHSAGVIHRDLKPANVVCFQHRRNNDFAKVLDFGIAKIIDPDDNSQPLTREGIVCGTPAYMSPEQVQGFPLDNRSDLFSLGIILYQTLTGRLPFLAESAVEVATKIVIEHPVPPSQVRSDWSYPPELEAIVLKLLKKDREQRYVNAMEVRGALERCLATLRERSDASLDLPPDEVAKLLADIHVPSDGTDTVRIDEDLVADIIRRPLENLSTALTPDAFPSLSDPTPPLEPVPPEEPAPVQTPSAHQSRSRPDPSTVETSVTTSIRELTRGLRRRRNLGMAAGVAAIFAVLGLFYLAL